MFNSYQHSDGASAIRKAAFFILQSLFVDKTNITDDVRTGTKSDTTYSSYFIVQWLIRV